MLKDHALNSISSHARKWTSNQYKSVSTLNKMWLFINKIRIVKGVNFKSAIKLSSHSKKLLRKILNDPLHLNILENLVSYGTLRQRATPWCWNVNISVWAEIANRGSTTLYTISWFFEYERLWNLPSILTVNNIPRSL